MGTTREVPAVRVCAYVSRKRVVASDIAPAPRGMRLHVMRRVGTLAGFSLLFAHRAATQLVHSREKKTPAHLVPAQCGVMQLGAQLHTPSYL